MSSPHCQFTSCSISGQAVGVGEREGETFSDLSRRTISISSAEGESPGRSSEDGTVVDLTNDSGVEDAEIVNLTSPITDIDLLHNRSSCALVNRWEGSRERGRRRRSRRKRGNDVVVLDESDESSDEVQIMEPGSQATPSVPIAQSPTKSLIKCPICMENAATFERRGSQMVVTTCGHVFCSNCIQRSIAEQRKCPTCRKKLTVRQFHPLYLST